MFEIEVQASLLLLIHILAFVQGLVYLHPRSSVARLAPEYITYGEILQTTRAYLRHVSICKAEWLAGSSEYHTTLSKPLDDPSPFYDSKLDEVRCWTQPSFGVHLWQLPLFSTTYSDKHGKYAVFAAALLNGRVIPELSQLQGSLVAAPATCMRSDTSGIPRVNNLIQELKVCTCMNYVLTFS